MDRNQEPPELANRRRAEAPSQETANSCLASLQDLDGTASLDFVRKALSRLEHSVQELDSVSIASTRPTGHRSGAGNFTARIDDEGHLQLSCSRCNGSSDELLLTLFDHERFVAASRRADDDETETELREPEDDDPADAKASGVTDDSWLLKAFHRLHSKGPTHDRE